MCRELSVPGLHLTTESPVKSRASLWLSKCRAGKSELRTSSPRYSYVHQMWKPHPQFVMWVRTLEYNIIILIQPFLTPGVPQILSLILQHQNDFNSMLRLYLPFFTVLIFECKCNSERNCWCLSMNQGSGIQPYLLYSSPPFKTTLWKTKMTVLLENVLDEAVNVLISTLEYMSF